MYRPRQQMAGPGMGPIRGTASPQIMVTLADVALALLHVRAMADQEVHLSNALLREETTSAEVARPGKPGVRAHVLTRLLVSAPATSTKLAHEST